MITLITGTPGAGKTAWTVQELTRLPHQRKVYVHGIPKLQIAHEPIYCSSPLCDMCQSIPEDQRLTSYYVENWPEWVTDGSLIVIDEVQRIWRPSNSAQKLPDDISRLETHRHNGLDFWLISQGPHLFHSNIRLLVGRHVHLVSSWSGRTEYEFPECRQDVTRRTDAVQRPYKLPKKIFCLYESASLHTKQSMRRPLSLYIFLLLAVIVSWASYRTYERMKNKTQPGETTELKETPKTGLINAPTTNRFQSPGYPDFKPTNPSVPSTAPAYASFNQVTQAPHLIGCVKTPDWCKCYSRQSVPVPVTLQFCTEFVAGHYFNPFRGSRPVENQQNQTVIASSAEPTK